MDVHCWRILARSRSYFALLGELLLACSWFLYFVAYICQIFVIITFSYTELQIFFFCCVLLNLQSSCTKLILSFRQPLSSFYFHFLFFSLSFSLFLISISVAFSPLNTNHNVLTSFIALFGTANSKAKLHSLDLFVMSLLKWVYTASVSDAEEIVMKIKLQVTRRNFALKQFQFLKSENLEFGDLWTEQMCQFLRACVVVYF